MAERADDKKKEEKKAEKKPEPKKEEREEKKDDKKSKQKEVISKLAEQDRGEELPPEKSELHATGRAKKISINLSFELEPAMRAKIPFLLAMLLFTAIAFIMLAKVGFSFTDVFDFQRISNNLEKIFSISFILFLLLYSCALALSVFFGFNIKPTNAFVTSLLIAIPILIAFFLEPRFLLAYIWLGFGIILAILFGTLLEDLSFWSIYRTLGGALFILLVVAVLFTVVKVHSQKDEYFDLFVNNIANLAPQLQGEVQDSLGDLIDGIKVTPKDVADVTSQNPSKYIDRGGVSSLASLQYPSFREVTVNSFEEGQDRTYADGIIPKTFGELDISSRNKLVDDTFSYLQEPSTSALSSGAIVAVWPEIRSTKADDVREATPNKNLTDEDLSNVREKLNDIPFMVQFYDYFEVFIALLVLSLLSVGNLILRLLSTGLVYGITRIL